MRRATCEEKYQIAITNLKKWGYFAPGVHHGGVLWLNDNTKSSINLTSYINSDLTGSIILNYTITWYGESEKHFVNYPIIITTTRCNFGNVRQWFVCPINTGGISCSRRSARLYLSGKYFGCRRCHALPFSTQYKHRSGIGGLFDAVYGYREIEKKIKALRTKYWHGLPTKRHGTLLKRLGRNANTLPQLSADIDKLINKTKGVK
jgi:hypothetical protein